MIWHPLVIGSALLDALSVGLTAWTGLNGIRLLVRSDDSSSTRNDTPFAPTLARLGWITGSSAVALLLLIGGVTQVFPGEIPGAMCGTGVMAAMGRAGPVAVILRGIGLWILIQVFMMARLNGKSTPARLNPLIARWLLLALPVVFLGVFNTYAGVLSVDTEETVGCCAAVYGSVQREGETERETDGASIGPAIPVVLGGWLALIGLGLTVSRRSVRPSRWLVGGVGALSVVWAVLAADTLVTWAPVYFEGLDHRCLWCLFSIDHYGIGFPLLCCLFTVCTAGPAAFIALVIARQHETLGAAGIHHCRWAVRTTLVAATVYWVLVALPVVV